MTPGPVLAGITAFGLVLFGVVRSSTARAESNRDAWAIKLNAALLVVLVVAGYLGWLYTRGELMAPVAP